MKEKTKRQSEILDFIATEIISNGLPPTLKEIGDRFSMTPEGAYYAVHALEKKGCLTISKDRKRSITLTGIERDERENVPVPFFSSEPVAADFERKAEKTMMVRRGTALSGVFAYTVTSESMKNAGILPGDTAVIRRTDTASDGDIVLALKDEESPLELRRLHTSTSFSELWAENDTMGIIRRKNFPIYGILIEIRRNY